MHRRPVERRVALPHRQVVRDRERLAVADHHADNRPGGDHRSYQGLVGHLGETDLVFWTFGALVGEGERGQGLFVRAPSEFRGCDALLVEPVHTPGVHELADFLWLIGDLRVAFGDVNSADLEQLCEHVEATLGHCGSNLLVALGEQPVAQDRFGDLNERLLDEMAHQTRVSPVLHDGRGSVVRSPLGDLSAKVHVTPVERALLG